MAAKKSERKMHLTDYLWVLKKRMLLIVFFWTAVFAVVAVMTFMKRPLYKATAMMLIERDVNQPRLPGVDRAVATAEWYNSQFRQLKGRAIARKLYHGLAMDNWEYFRKLSPEKDPYDEVASWIHVSPVPKTHLVEIWVVWDDGRLAADMVNFVCRAYMDTVQENRTKTMENSLIALDKRAEELDGRLRTVTNQIERLTAEGGMHAVPELQGIMLMRQTRLQDAGAAAQVEVINAKSMHDALQLQIDEGRFEMMQADDVLDVLVTKRYSVQEVMRLDSYQRTERYRKQDEFSRTLTVRLEEIDRQIAMERARVQRAAMSRAAQELATAEANRDILDKMLLDTRADLQRIGSDLLKLRAYEKNQEGLQLIQTELRKTAEAVRTLDKYDQTTATVISGEAAEPKETYSPKVGLNLGLAAVVGLLVGIGAAFFFEYLNTTIRMPRDIEDGLGLPVLGFVPAMSSKLKDFATRSRICHLDSNSGPAEAFRGIRTEVMLRSDLRQVKTGMVTSTSPQEGKTTVAVNWAIALAQTGNKVLLIDADLRKPQIGQAFNMKADKGLSTLLSEKDTATVYIKKTDIENLHVLPGGPVPQNPAELLGSRKMRTLVAEAAERYDSVIIDASPVLGVADANILSTMVDCVVLVVKASMNRRALVMRAKNQLASVNARLAGAVLNNVRGTKGDYYYYRQYYRPVAEIMEATESR